MRTTVTLDPDVAQELKALQKARGLQPKTAINEALRRGLREMHKEEPKPEPFVLKTANMGQFLFDTNNLREIMAQMDEEEYLEKERRSGLRP